MNLDDLKADFPGITAEVWKSGDESITTLTVTPVSGPKVHCAGFNLGDCCMVMATELTRLKLAGDLR